MANYKPDLSSQNKFIPIDFSQQITPGTFEYALAHIVDNRLDLSGFDKWYKTSGVTHKSAVVNSAIKVGSLFSKHYGLCTL